MKESMSLHSRSICPTATRRRRARSFLYPAVLYPAIALLSGCALGPDYTRPPAAIATDWKTTTTGPDAVDRGWRPVSTAPRIAGPWWDIYDDPVLADLLSQVTVSNQELAQAEARYQQALALTRSARAQLWPEVGAGANVQRSGTGSDDAGEFIGDTSRRSGKSYTAQLNIGWELDLWGRIRRQLEAERAATAATAAELAAARLSLQTILAQNYFELRILDQQQRLLDATLVAFQRSVELSENRYRAGITARSDVIQALTQLETTRAEAVDLARQRALRENAIAVLVGMAPTGFVLPPAEFGVALPPVPVGLPAELLQRRPDIIAAERAVAAANAAIGVAETAWFPTLTLSASGGYQNDTSINLFEVPNRFWSVGPALAATLFDGGARRAELNRVEAVYDERVAAYRQTVLSALEEVQNALTTLDVLNRSAAVRARAVELAEEAERLLTNQYRAGRISFLEVASAQATTLNNRRTLLDLQAEQLTASVQLITALGGDWDASALPAALVDDDGAEANSGPAPL